LVPICMAATLRQWTERAGNGACAPLSSSAGRWRHKQKNRHLAAAGEIQRGSDGLGSPSYGPLAQGFLADAPDFRRGQLDAVAGGIAEVKTAPAAGPVDGPLDGDAVLAELL
jgi:hypothetical protein